MNGDDTSAYTDKTISGNVLTFTPKPGEFMVSLRDALSDDNIDTLVAQQGFLQVSAGFSKPGNFVAVRALPPPDTQAERSPEARVGDLGTFLPVMVDQNGLDRYFLPDEFTVQFRDGVSPERAEQIIAEKNCVVIKKQRTPGYYTLAVSEKQSLFGIIREFVATDAGPLRRAKRDQFQQHIGVHSDECGLRQAVGHCATPGRPSTVSPGHPVRTSARPMHGRSNAEALEVIIVVVDTGVDLDHPNLQANILAPRADDEDWDFADLDDAKPDDVAIDRPRLARGGHGVGGRRRQQGVVGVAHRCRLLPLRIDVNAGKNCQNRADAIQFAAQRAADDGSTARYVMNLSWKANGDHAGIRTAIGTAFANNIVIVCAAGNFPVGSRFSLAWMSGRRHGRRRVVRTSRDAGQPHNPPQQRRQPSVGPAFATLATTSKRRQQLILNAVEHGLSNARSEATDP